MIAKGTTHDNGGKLAVYMVSGKPGEQAELWQVRGFAVDDIKIAFRSVHVMAEATRCEQPLFHVQVRNPAGEHLSRQQWEHVADRIEGKLGLREQPRAIAFHREAATGNEHMHIGWSRIDQETMTARALPFFKLRLKEVSRELETELGLTPVRNEREGPVMAPTRDEDEQARRLGVDIRDVRATIRECWERSDSGRAFAAALSNEGLALAKGDKRDFVAVDAEGGIHALGKRVLGNTAGEVRERMADLTREQLPTIDEAREQLAQRRQVAEHPATLADDRDWKADVLRAGKNATARLPSGTERLAPIKPEASLDDSVAEIEPAFRSSRDANEFVTTIGRNGIRLAIATADEAKHDNRYQTGEVVAVTRTGRVCQFSQFSVDRSEAERFFAALDRKELNGIEATQEQMHLEVRLHIELAQVGTLSTSDRNKQNENSATARFTESDDRPRWERLLFDPEYRRKVLKETRERQQNRLSEAAEERCRERERP